MKFMIQRRSANIRSIGFFLRKKAPFWRFSSKRCRNFPFVTAQRCRITEKAAFSKLPENVCDHKASQNGEHSDWGAHSSVTAMAVASDFHRTFLLIFTPFGTKPFRIVFSYENYSTRPPFCQRFEKTYPHFTGEKREFTKAASFDLGQFSWK